MDNPFRIKQDQHEKSSMSKEMCSTGGGGVGE